MKNGLEESQSLQLDLVFGRFISPYLGASAYFFVIGMSLDTGDREVDFPFHEVWEEQ